MDLVFLIIKSILILIYVKGNEQTINNDSKTEELLPQSSGMHFTGEIFPLMFILMLSYHKNLLGHMEVSFHIQGAFLCS